MSAGAQLSSRLDELFSMINVDDIRPSLLHGDLWSGNYAADAAGRPTIYDCACYYGHYEADHGINYMFGGGEAFRNKGYRAALPPEPGHERRALLYELHHHLIAIHSLHIKFNNRFEDKGKQYYNKRCVC